MASKSYKNFQKNLKDVERLIDSHKNESGTKPGKKGLGHLTRSGVVMLSAAFEVYIEELIEEVVNYFIQEYRSLKDFPKPLRKRIAFYTKSSKNELEVLNLVGNGWENVLCNCLNNDLKSLHSPKSNKIDILFNRYLGLKSFSDKWELEKSILDKFISRRGEIAHNGAKAKYIKIKYLKKTVKFIKSLVVYIDKKVCDHVSSLLPDSSQPWRKRYNS